MGTEQRVDRETEGDREMEREMAAGSQLVPTAAPSATGNQFDVTLYGAPAHGPFSILYSYYYEIKLKHRSLTPPPPCLQFSCEYDMHINK